MSEKLLPQNSIPGTFLRTMSRRSVLRGAGVVMALPWLESIRVLGAPAPFPKRFGVMFMGCGINEDYWSASRRSPTTSERPCSRSPSGSSKT